MRLLTISLCTAVAVAQTQTAPPTTPKQRRHARDLSYKPIDLPGIATPNTSTIDIWHQPLKEAKVAEFYPNKIPRLRNITVAEFNRRVSRGEAFIISDIFGKDDAEKPYRLRDFGCDEFSKTFKHGK